MLESKNKKIKVGKGQKEWDGDRLLLTFLKKQPIPTLNGLQNKLNLMLLQNIFPLAKISFAKGKMIGAGRHPTGPV